MNNFLAFDGESIDNSYILLANNLGDTLESKNHLSFDEVAEWLVSLHKKYKSRKYVWIGFGLNYDVEMWCKTLPNEIKDKLFYKNETDYLNYKITWLPRKFFALECKGVKIIIYDVFSFFLTSFLKVVEKHLDVNDAILDWGKASRSIFTWKQYEEIKRYNKLECQLLVAVMQKLKVDIDKLNIPLQHWYGSSALAQATMQKLQIEENYRGLNESFLKDDLLDAFNRAYFGGRIELLKLGSFNQKIYTYDINSAYPTAISILPQCNYVWKKIKWNEQLFTDPYYYFSIWKVRYNYKTSIPIFPFRDSAGNIFFRQKGEGFYWFPEVQEALRRYPNEITIEYGWKQPYTSKANFTEKIKAIYKTRRKYKEQGNSMEYVLKILLNSLYGKFAQSVGTASFRNIAYAGFITSYTRAALMRYIEKPDDVIGFATDSIFSLSPINVPLGDELGQWSESNYDCGTFVMPGLYRLTYKGKHKIAQRGYGNSFDFTSLLHHLNVNNTAPVGVKTFIGYKRAKTQMNAFGDYYLKFVEYTKNVQPLLLKKRKYNFKPAMDWVNQAIDSQPLQGGYVLSHPYSKVEESEELRLQCRI